nr:hypothetical protein GCM10025699_43950 [Microbacterium flavescens]
MRPRRRGRRPALGRDHLDPHRQPRRIRHRGRQRLVQPERAAVVTDRHVPAAGGLSGLSDLVRDPHLRRVGHRPEHGRRHDDAVRRRRGDGHRRLGPDDRDDDHGRRRRLHAACADGRPRLHGDDHPARRSRRGDQPDVLLVDGDRADLDFAFTTTTAPEPATVDITGTITDETGDPVADTPIEIIPADEPTAPDVSTTTDDTGTFDAPGLAPETDYTIIVDGDTDRPIEFTTPALDAPNPPLELALPDAPVDPTPATVDITGTITDETGDPVADTPIEIIPADEPTAPDVSTTTDDTGTFDAPGLAPETDYTIIVDGDTDRPIEFTTPALDAPNPPLDLALPDAPVDPTPATVDVTGTITDETGDPVADTPIEIIPADEPTAPDVSTTTDDTGAFDAPGLAPETDYTIIVDGDTDRPIEFTTPALDAPNPPLELALPDAPVDPTPEPTPTPTPEPTPTPVPATVSVDGTVSDILGAPVTDAPVEVLPVESADVVAASTTDASGAFVVDGLAPDTDYRLFVDGYSVAVFTTGADDVSLGSLILVRGVVPTPDDPIGGPSVGGPGTGLAFTGSDTGAPIGVAAGLVALGLVLTAGAAVRRRRAAVEERE